MSQDLCLKVQFQIKVNFKRKQKLKEISNKKVVMVKKQQERRWELPTQSRNLLMKLCLQDSLRRW